ncbi:hypothetical protein RQP46_007440 [Phenoliferia psychrophenolica]
MQQPRAPPASPTKPKNFWRELVSGVTPTDTISHQQSWGKQRPAPTAAPAPGQGTRPGPGPGPTSSRVAGLVNAYESSSLSSSRPYAMHPSPASPPPPSPQSVPLPPSPTKYYPGRPLPSPAPSTPPSTVPASFFQQQQARRTPPAPSHPSPRAATTAAAGAGAGGKENRSVLSSTVRPSSSESNHRPSFSPSKPSQREKAQPRPPSLAATDASSDVSTGGTSTGGTSAENAVLSRAFVEPLRASTPTRIFVGSTPTLAPPRNNPQPTTTAAPLRPASSHSAFTEALPESYPSRQTPPLVSIPTFVAPLPRASLLQPTRREEMPREQPVVPVPYESYAPLPLDIQAPAPPVQKRGRPRASTLGSRTASVAQEESPRDKERRIEQEFEQLLDTMQLPSTSVRQKMAGLPTSMKEQMLLSKTSSAASRPLHMRGNSLAASTSASTSSPSSPAAAPSSKKEKPHPLLRKTKSSNSVASVRPTHNRTTSATGLLRSLGRSSGAAVAGAVGGSVGEEDATWWAVRIRSTGCEALEVKEVGRLRGRLRTEDPAWVEEFIKHGGYTGLMERLKQLLDVEWRQVPEEQHDDQILHELLRCFKALTLTSCGKRALASRSPSPFIALTSLLFSEKRPGDLPCRQILVELIHSLFDVRPASASAVTKDDWTSTITPISTGEGGGGGSGGFKRYTRKMKGGDEDDSEEARMSDDRTRKVHEMVLSLVIGAPDEKQEAKVDFAKSMVRPRQFKTWVTELSDTVRDFFWIFCHSGNVFWDIQEIDQDAIESPKVPSGMTGGVEFEAMAYCTTHFRLINALAKTCPTPQAALQFHYQLFESGFEHVLYTLRRASASYYQGLHLEMARYVGLAREARFLLPPRILGTLDSRSLGPEERRSLDNFQRRQPARAGAPRIPDTPFS